MLPLGWSATATEEKDFFNSQSVLLKWIDPGTLQMGGIQGSLADLVNGGGSDGIPLGFELGRFQRSLHSPGCHTK